MKTWMLAVVAFAAATLPCLAQEKTPKTEGPKSEAGLPAPEPCGTRMLWVDYSIPVKTLHVEKEDRVRTEKIDTYEVQYVPEVRTFQTMEIRHRPVKREETICCTEPVTTVDPCTGCTTTSMQQVMRKRIVEDWVFEAVPAEQKETVMVPKLVPVTEEVKHKYTIYQWKTDLVKKGCVVRVPGAIVPDTHQCIVPPKPDCGQ